MTRPANDNTPLPRRRSLLWEVYTLAALILAYAVSLRIAA